MLYSITRDVLCFIGSKASCRKKSRSDSREEKVICRWSNFRDRPTDIVAYRGAVCNQKGSPRVHWIYGGLHAKYQEMRKPLKVLKV